MRFASTLLAATLAVASSPAHAADVALDGHTVVLPAPITFETGTAKLNNEAALAPVVAYLAQKSYISTLRIEGHVSAGTPDAQKLTEARALAVARALIARGVDCKRLLPVGFGDTKPAADNGSPDGRAQNNRITLANAALRGRAIGGMPLDGGGRPAADPCKG